MNKFSHGKMRSVGSVLALLLCTASGVLQAQTAANGKVLVQLTTVDQRDGKVHGKSLKRMCVPAGSFPAHMLIGQHATDSSCQVVQAPAGEGSFFRFSCEGGNVTISGSVRKLTAESFTSSYVEAIGAERISRGIVGQVVDNCQ
jgi:hypothetical protein